VNQDVHASVTSYLFTDGINSYSSSNPNTRPDIFNISTNAAGNIIAASSEVQIKLWQSGSSPHTAGDRFAIFDVCSGCLPFGGDGAGNNGDCTAVGTSIAPDSCVGGSADASTSQATAGSNGTWSTLAPPQQSSSIPTLSEWALILLSLLVAGFAVRALSLRRRR
jgi:hypothetical protein